MNKPSYSQQILLLPHRCRDDMHSTDMMVGYLIGHREVRDTAAELAAKADATIYELAHALRGIVAIPHKPDGGDWDEIEEAQKIAAIALASLPTVELQP